MSDEVLRYEQEGRVAAITLHRPEKRNALSRGLVAHLKAALEDAAADERVRVIVLTGAGTAFSAGADLAMLRRLQEADVEDNLQDSQQLAGLFEQVYTHPKPIIAKVNGAAIGGGCGLAAACDFSIARVDARLGFTEVRLGFVPAIVMIFVRRKLGETRARDLLLRGKLVTAEEAAEMGLVSHAVPAEALEETVDELARELASETSGTAVALTKRMMANLPGMGLREALSYAAEMNALARGTADCRAGIDAFLNKQDPPWKEHE